MNNTIRRWLLSLAAAAWIMVIVLASASCPALADERVLICGFESLQGMAVTWGQKISPTIELSDNRRYVTQGRYCVHLKARAPADAKGNIYIGFRLPLASPVDLRKRVIHFDAASPTPDLTQAIYFRAYDVDGRMVLSFSGWHAPLTETPKTFTLIPRLGGSGFSWEQKNIHQQGDLGRVAAVEIIVGTGKKGVVFEAYVDNLTAEATPMQTWDQVKQPKKRYPQTPLVSGGKARAVVMAPAAKAWDSAVQAIVQALQQATGLQFPVRRIPTVSELFSAGKLPCSSGLTAQPQLDPSMWGGAPPQLDGHPATPVIIGNVADNAALLYFYARSFCWPDHLYPGPGGWEIRTVHDPWGKAINALIIAASDPAGAIAAVEPLKSLLDAAERDEQSFILPRFCRTHLAGQAANRFGKLLRLDPSEKYIESQKTIAERRLQRGAHTGLFGQIAQVGDHYIRTRKSGFAKLFVWLVARAYEHYKTKPKTYGGPWGMDSDFMIHRVLPAWDVVEEDPALTDQERWETTQILYKWVSDVGVRKASSVAGNHRPRFNHQTFPALGLLFAGEYFSRHYHIFEARHWLEIADECFQFQAKCFKSHEDCNGYQWLVWTHLLQYALARPDFAFFVPRPLRDHSSAVADSPAAPRRPSSERSSARRGALWAQCSNARRVADYALLGTDSFGYATTYGDTGAFHGWWAEIPVLQMINFVLRDPGYQWAIQRKQKLSGRLSERGWHVNLPAREPRSLAGLHIFPLDERWWASFGGKGAVPLERATDKVCIRSGFSDADAYLLLDGLKPGGHRHFDVNAISRVCLAGRIWVADASYYNQAAKYHSLAFVLRDGLASPHPDFVQLSHAADLPNCAAVETVLNAYNGCDWHRWVMWQRDLGILVADRFVAHEDGDYSFRIYWQLLGEPQQEDGRVVLEQAGCQAALSFTQDATPVLTTDWQAGANWEAYPFLRIPAVRVLRLIYDVHLRRGQDFVAWSLLTARQGEVGHVRLIRDGKYSVIITGPQRQTQLPTPAAAGIGQEPTVGPEAIRKKCAAWMVWPTGAMLVATAGHDEAIQFDSGQLTSERPTITEPDQQATVSVRQDKKVRVAPDRVRQEIARRAVAARTAGAPSRPSAPELKPAWTLWPHPESFVLTGNHNTDNAAACLENVSCSPEPLERNIFGGGSNQIENLFDGAVSSTRNCVMWAVDQPVTVQLDLDAEYELTELDVRAWFATSSSKGTKFQLREITAEVSSDGFANDVRRAGHLIDEQDHENWGGRAHLPETYRIPLGGQRASAVRIHFKPRPGTAVYLAELYLRGRGGPLATTQGLKERLLSMNHFTCLAPIDLSGQTALAAGRSDGQVWKIGADGKVAWKKDVGREVLSVGTVKFDGHIPTIVCGCRDGLVVALALDGSELWRTQIPYYKQPPHVRVVIAADFSGDGRQTALVGADSWRYYALDPAGRILWHYESVHVSTAAAAADIDGDGRDEVALGTNYHWWSAVRGDGSRLWHFSTKAGPECTAVAAADLDGDRRAEVAFGVADGTIQVVGPDGKLKWMVDTSDAISFLGCRDINGDGQPELLAASASGIAYAFDQRGQVLWHRSLLQPISAAVLWSSNLVCACADGSIWLIDTADGSLAGRLAAVGEPVTAASLGPLAVVATDLGQLVAVGEKG